MCLFSKPKTNLLELAQQMREAQDRRRAEAAKGTAAKADRFEQLKSARARREGRSVIFWSSRNPPPKTSPARAARFRLSSV